MTRWDEIAAQSSGASYAARFQALERRGVDVHGEAGFCAGLIEPGAHVLDAGCGTGRVATELARRGFDCVGVDLSESMLAEARAAAPELEWVQADLTTFDLDRTFDLVVAAGNVIPLLEAGSEPAAVARLAAHVRPGGLLVCGFGLDAAHLPLDQAPFGLAEYDEWCAAAGMGLAARYATWGGGRYDHDIAQYAVSVHAQGGMG